jgi:two-component system, response regulator FlrC
MREEVAAGRFREDLFYRLNVFPLHLAPLRERPRDILPIAQRLIERHCPPGLAMPNLCPSAERLLLGYAWPGNVRELENVLQRAIILMSGDCIDAADLHFELGGPGMAEAAPAAAAIPAGASSERLDDDLKNHEQTLILEALAAGKGSRKVAAERLGISPRTLRYKLARMREDGIAVPG